MVSIEGRSDDVLRLPAVGVHDSLTTALVQAGASPGTLRVEIVEALDRDQGHGANFKLIESRVAANSTA